MLKFKPNQQSFKPNKLQTIQLIFNPNQICKFQLNFLKSLIINSNFILRLAKHDLYIILK